MKLSTAFHTKWALTWAGNVKEFTKSNEALSYTNVRATICEAQREFERHLSEVMNYGSHQPLY